MKFLLLTTLVALATADVSHLLNTQQQPTFQYQIPQSSYGAPQASVLGNFDGSGSVQSVSYSGSDAGVAPELTLPSAAGSTLQFNSGSPSALSGISSGTIQTFENGAFSTPVPLSQEELAKYQASTPAPSVGISSYQALSKLNQPSVSTIGFNSDSFGSTAARTGSYGSGGQFNAGLGLGEKSSPSSVGSSSSYQFLSKLSQPSVPTIEFNSARFGSKAALTGSYGSGGQFNAGRGLGGSTGFASDDAQLNSGPGSKAALTGSYGSGGQFNAGLGLGGSTGFASDDSQLNSGPGSKAALTGSYGSGGQFNAGLGLGGSTGFASGDSQLNSGLGGSINDAFGVSTNTDDVSEHAQDQLEPEVSKHLYFFDAPEDEEEEAEAKISLPPVAPKKTYKIIFIKAPSYRNQGIITVPAAPPTEEKTLVYVLVKKPEKNTNVRYQSAVPSKPSKPEVFFIKYKTQKEAEDAVAEIQNKHGATGQVIANLPAGRTIDHIQIPSNIGVSSSPSVSFGGQSHDGFGGDSFDTLGAKSIDSSSIPSFGVEARSGAGDPTQDNASAQSENEQAQVGQGGSSGSLQTFGQQSVSSFQGASSQSEASATSSTGEDNESQPDVDSGASNQGSDSSASNSQDDESSPKDNDSSSNVNPEEQDKDSENGGIGGVQARTYQDSEGEGSNVSPFNTYGAPNPSLFKKYGPPEV